MTTTSTKRFSANLSRLARDIEELRKESHGLSEYDKLCGEQVLLKQKLQQKGQEIDEKNRGMVDLRRVKDDELASLRAEIERLKMVDQILTQKYQTQFKAWDTDRQRFSTEAERLSRIQKECQQWKQRTHHAESANEQLSQLVDQITKEAEGHQSKISQLERDLQVKSLITESAIEEKRALQTQLVNAEKEIGVIAVDRRQSVDELEKLASRSAQLAQTFALGEVALPEGFSNVASPASTRIPQVASNTEAATHMRCAVVEAIIAEQLSASIFQDFYISASDKLNLRELTEVLSRLDKGHPRKANIIRYQIATAFENPQTQNSIILCTVDNVDRLLRPWLTESTVRERLKHDLAEFFRDALDLWKRLRRDTVHATAQANVTSDQWELDDARQQYDTVKIDEHYGFPGAALASTSPSAVLFPQIWIGNHVLFHGHALFPSQSAVIAANLEVERSKISNSSIRRRRRSSVMVPTPNQVILENEASKSSKH